MCFILKLRGFSPFRSTFHFLLSDHFPSFFLCAVISILRESILILLCHCSPLGVFGVLPVESPCHIGGDGAQVDVWDRFSLPVSGKISMEIHHSDDVKTQLKCPTSLEKGVPQSLVAVPVPLPGHGLSSVGGCWGLCPGFLLLHLFGHWEHNGKASERRRWRICPVLKQVRKPLPEFQNGLDCEGPERPCSPNPCTGT